MFNQSSSSPFDDPFFRDRPRFMRSDIFDRVAPMRRLNSCDDALRGVVRNIPIRVQGAEVKTTDSVASDSGYGSTANSAPAGPFQRRFSESSGSGLNIPPPREFRRVLRFSFDCWDFGCDTVFI
ncbi:unnamed protein product [Nippostrongylus brasiliensis]|uniref:Uncharacterized protein n=1 Tax=Nippostrongylus brasiliensis TaxID=27835 RepID=A0A0N4YSV5_NIPBR|nr:unnamed protein product [Nippostrongylus brasiliensis]